ncbi:MAG: aminomethyl-transferring glycine dehydrogenase subunit GcvPA [Candidatus Omnitrophota bacterium]|nr:MAG: aminomethyl-transferring glycine dehydrogenase subunit GcvPA [Candidatus Omnitrophota bacterium]
MLKAIGIDSIEELYSQLPARIKLTKPLNLSSGLSEHKTKKRVSALAKKNVPAEEFNSFLGAGCYDHYVPSVVPFILSSSQFLTAYTPYQPECSQGALQAIYEYQSYMCLLTGMDISNASLLDGASAFAEAVLMSLRITKKKKVIVAGIFHPEYRQTLKAYLAGFDFVIREIAEGTDGLVDTEALKQALDNDTGCCAFSSPNFFGLIEDAPKLADIAKRYGTLTVLVTNPISLAILKEPGAFGVDIVCGDGQPLGSGLNFGGPSFGYLATKKEYTRQMPGRLVGKTTDREGKCAYCLTLQTREQHIRREKATSNICSNQSLNAIGAAVYLALMGPQGLRNSALCSFNNTLYLYNQLKPLKKINLPFGPRIFNEFVWEVKNAQKIIEQLYRRNIIAGYYLGEQFPEYKNGILSCCTEKKTKEEIDELVGVLREVPGG